jgi:hypothetical protein
VSSSAAIPVKGTARDPELRRRNIKLGVIVAVIAFAVMVTFLVRFLVWGLPKDRTAYEKLEQRRSAEAAAEHEDAVHD